MANIKKTASIPSICIDRDFLKQLGEIIEKESRDRIIAGKRIATERSKLREKEIRNSSSYGSDEAKAEEIRRVNEHEQYIAKPHVSVSYTISTNIERLSFDSMKELLDTELIPEEITSFGARVSHYNSEYVDIDFQVSKPFFGLLFFVVPSTYDLSSSKQTSLLDVSLRIERLINKSRPGYHTYLYFGSHLSYTLTFLASLAISFLSARLIVHQLDFFSLQVRAYTFVYGWLALYFSVGSFIKWLYPYYEFTITTDNLRRSLRNIFGVIALGIIGSGIYDFLK